MSECVEIRAQIDPIAAFRLDFGVGRYLLTRKRSWGQFRVLISAQ